MRSFVDPGLGSELIEREVDIRSTPLQTGNSFLSLLLWSFGPAILIVGLYVWLFRRAAKEGGGMFGGLVGLGKSKARRIDKETETRSEEHTSELKSLMRVSNADFCFKKKTNY